jgi:hypothetical protein
MTNSEYDVYLGKWSYNHKLLGNRRELMRQYPRLDKFTSVADAEKQVKQLEKLRKGNK